MDWVPNVKARGFEVRELVVKPTSERIADKILSDSLAVIDAGRTRRRTRDEHEAKYLAENPDRRRTSRQADDGA